MRCHIYSCEYYYSFYYSKKGIIIKIREKWGIFHFLTLLEKDSDDNANNSKIVEPLPGIFGYFIEFQFEITSNNNIKRDDFFRLFSMYWAGIGTRNSFWRITLYLEFYFLFQLSSSLGIAKLATQMSHMIYNMHTWIPLIITNPILTFVSHTWNFCSVVHKINVLWKRFRSFHEKIPHLFLLLLIIIIIQKCFKVEQAILHGTSLLHSYKKFFSIL